MFTLSCTCGHPLNTSTECISAVAWSAHEVCPGCGAPHATGPDPKASPTPDWHDGLPRPAVDERELAHWSGYRRAFRDLYLTDTE